MIQYELKDFDYALEDILKQTDLTIDALMFSKVYGTSNMTPQMAMECNEHFNFTIPVSSVKNGFSLSTRRIAMEGIVGSIIDKLKAFFRWIGEKLGIISSSASTVHETTQKTEETIKQTKAETEQNAKDVEEAVKVGDVEILSSKNTNKKSKMKFGNNDDEIIDVEVTEVSSSKDKNGNTKAESKPKFTPEQIMKMRIKILALSDPKTIELLNKMTNIIKRLMETFPNTDNVNSAIRGAYESLSRFSRSYDDIFARFKNGDTSIDDTVNKSDKENLEKLIAQLNKIAIPPHFIKERADLQKEFNNLSKELNNLVNSKQQEFFTLSAEQMEKLDKGLPESIIQVKKSMENSFILNGLAEQYIKKINALAAWESTFEKNSFRIDDRKFNETFEGKVNNEEMKAALAIFEERRQLSQSMLKQMHTALLIAREDSKLMKVVEKVNTEYNDLFKDLKELLSGNQ